MIANSDEAPNITPVQKIHSIALRQSKDHRLNNGDRVHNHGVEKIFITNTREGKRPAFNFKKAPLFKV